MQFNGSEANFEQVFFLRRPKFPFKQLQVCFYQVLIPMPHMYLTIDLTTEPTDLSCRILAAPCYYLYCH